MDDEKRSALQDALQATMRQHQAQHDRIERQMRWHTYRMYAVMALLLIWVGIKIYHAVYP